MPKPLMSVRNEPGVREQSALRLAAGSLILRPVLDSQVFAQAVLVHTGTEPRLQELGKCRGIIRVMVLVQGCI